MPIDPNALASSPFGTLMLALAVIGAFISGTIVSGRTHGELVASIGKLTDTVGTLIEIVKEDLRSRRDHF